jgi:putative peptidoglycan lipid II flippase
VLFIVLRIPIVRLVFGAKTFPWAATLLTGKTLAILSASATFAAAQAFISRGFYSLHDTKTPLKIGIIAALLGSLAAVLISIVLKLELTGLAIVMSLTTVIECSALFLLFSRNLKFDSFGQSHYIYKLVIPMAKMLITSFIMGLSLWVPMRLLDQFVFDTTRTIPLFILTCISSIIGISVYLFLSFLFRVDELGSFLSMFARLKNWRQFITPLKSPEPIILPVEDQN